MAPRLRWAAPLLPYQVQGVQALLSRPGLLLADDMGLGKTIQAIAALRLLVARGEVQRSLVIAPAAVLVQWRREMLRWAPELRAIVIRGGADERAWQWRADVHVTLVGYESFRADAGGPGSPPRRVAWDLVILDEAQRIKNREIQVAQAAKLLSRRRSWALTGTPLENQVDDLASIMEFVDHVEGQPGPRWVPGPALLERQRQVQLRRRKGDVLPQLPPKQVVEVELELSGAQAVAYRRAEVAGLVRLRALGEELRIRHVLELIVRLKQLCNVDPVSGRSAKLSDLADRIDRLAAQGHRALVFSQFADDRFGAAMIAARLAAHDPLLYTGSLEQAARAHLVRRFQEEARHRVLVLSLRAGGTGLNLQAASYVFHLDRWWNPAIERQAEDRAHRLGQSAPVTVYAYTCLDTIEERIRDILARKQRLFDDVVDDVSMDLTRRLDAAELRGLVGL